MYSPRDPTRLIAKVEQGDVDVREMDRLQKQGTIVQCVDRDRAALLTRLSVGTYAMLGLSCLLLLWRVRTCSPLGYLGCRVHTPPIRAWLNILRVIVTSWCRALRNRLFLCRSSRRNCRAVDSRSWVAGHRGTRVPKLSTTLVCEVYSGERSSLPAAVCFCDGSGVYCRCFFGSSVIRACEGNSAQDKAAASTPRLERSETRSVGRCGRFRTHCRVGFLASVLPGVAPAPLLARLLMRNLVNQVSQNIVPCEFAAPILNRNLV